MFLFKNFVPQCFIFLFLLGSCSSPRQTILTDERDGLSYPVVEIGGQFWMGTNLGYLPSVYPAESDSGFYVYGYEGYLVDKAKETEAYKTFGCLYNWAVAMNLPAEANERFNPLPESPHRGICPEGWHIPSNKEVTELENLLETFADYMKEDERRNTGDAGKKLKSQFGWYENGNGTNETGFSMLPSGIRYQDGYFTKQGQYGYFWTSTEAYEGSAYYRYMVFNSDGTYIGYPGKKNGIPVRCLKN